MADLLQLVAPVEIQAAAPAGDKPATFSIVAYSGGIFSAPNWPESVIDLAGAQIDGPTALLLGHRSGDLEALAGRGTASIEQGQLMFRGTLTRATPAGQLAIGIARDGVALEASVGYEPLEVEFVQPGRQVNVNGRSFTAGQQGLRIARRGRLREVSLVSTGGDPNTSVSIAAQRSQTMANENQATTNAGQPANQAMQAAWEAPNLTDPQRVEMRWSAARWHCDDGGEGPRQRAQQAMIAASRGAIPYSDFERVLLTEQYRDSELCRIRAERPQAPAIQGSRRDLQPSVIECAFASQLNVKNLEKHYTPEILEAASSPRVRAIGLQQLLIEAAHANGYTGSQFVRRDNLKEVLAYAFPPMIPIQAASSIFVSGILSNLANKVLLDGFARVPAKWREVAAIKNVKDFKQNTFHRLTASLEYEELPPDGTIKHGTLGEETYTGQARTYAKMLSLTRTDIINDDLGAFDDLRTRIGMGGAIKLNRVFWTTWLAAADAGTFWTEARGNYVADATFGDTGIAAALKAFRLAQAPDGNLLDLEPDRVLVGPSNEAAARKFHVSSEMRDPTAAQRDPTGNIWQARFVPVAVAQLENEAFTGHSATNWWLAADPAILASAAVLFLDGQQQPTIESSDVDFDQLGVQLRGYHDFGVAMSEHRASVMCVAGE